MSWKWCRGEDPYLQAKISTVPKKLEPIFPFLYFFFLFGSINQLTDCLTDQLFSYLITDGKLSLTLRKKIIKLNLDTLRHLDNNI